MTPEIFSDIHQHVLWGLDDGSQSPEQMHALLQQDIEDGIRLVFATAHAHPKVRPFELNLYRERLAEANAYCRDKGWPLRVMPGCEIYYCDAVPDQLTAGRLPTLGDSRHVLIEFEPNVSPDEMKEAADKLYLAGYSPVLAHIERYRCLLSAPERAIEIREEYGFLYQMNCETVLFPKGFRQRHFVKRMLAERAVDAIATDAHDTLLRPVRMQEAYRLIAGKQGADYARQMVRLGWAFIDKTCTSDF